MGPASIETVAEVVTNSFWKEHWPCCFNAVVEVGALGVNEARGIPPLDVFS